MGCFQSKPRRKKDQSESSYHEEGSHPMGYDTFRLRADTSAKAKLNESGSIEDVYTLGDLLGKGGYARVQLGTHKGTGRQFAVKKIPVAPDARKAGSNDSTWDDIAAEVAVLCNLDHPHIIALEEFFVDDSTVFLVTSLVQGGELLKALARHGSYSEVVARQCFSQLLSGVAYMHEQGVAHRDIKLENLLLEKADDITNIKIVDFGLAFRHKGSQALQMDTICGTPHYIAPEIISANHKKGTYGRSVDVWACGVTLFLLLSGMPPFFETTPHLLYRKILKGHYAFQDPIWDLISPQAKDLIEKLLTLEPDMRLTARQALEHEWLRAPPLKATVSLAGAQANLQAMVRRPLSMDLDRSQAAVAIPKRAATLTTPLPD